MSGIHSDPEQLTEALSAYLDGALPAAERDALERHLAGCAQCQKELAGLIRVGALLRALPQPELPRSFTLPEPALRRARAISSRRMPAWTRAAQWAGGLAAALGLGLLVLGGLPHVGTESAAVAGDQRPTGQYGGQTSVSATPDHTPLYSNSPGTASGSPTITTTPTTTPAVVPTPTGTRGSSGGSSGTNGNRAPLEPVGAVLLIGGGAALAVGTVRRRRSRRDEAAGDR